MLKSIIPFPRTITRRCVLAIACVLTSLTGNRIEAAPVITSQPLPVSIVAGKNAAFRVSASGDNLVYQWFQGNAGDSTFPIAGATGPLFVLPRLRSATSYWVQVTDSTGNTNSQTAVVTMGQPLSARLLSFGKNSDGQLGDGTFTDRLTPAFITGDVTEVAAGESHTLFIKTDGSLWAMGNNNYGQLGDGATTDRNVPVKVGTDVIAAVAGSSHSLFLKSDSTLWAMGYNYYGQLGDGTTTNRSTPVQIAQGVLSVASAGDFTLFIKSDGGLWAVGQNDSGQLGDGTLTNRTNPVQVAQNVTDVSVGYSHSLFVKADGTLWSSGYNSFGQLGDGTSTNKATPAQVASGVARAVAGGQYSLFIRTNGDLWAMGNNSAGGYGNGTTNASLTPIKVLENVVTASARNGHTLFIKSDDSVWAAGYNSNGQLGDATTTNRSTPIKIGQNIAAFAAGAYHSIVADLTPSIATQSSDTGSPAGGTVELVVAATGQDLTYQWFTGNSGDTGSPIPGATSASYQTPPVNSNTNYWVRISNTYGSADSQTIQVVLITKPIITLPPASQTAAPGESAAISISASGQFLTYQWYRGPSADTSSPVPGATGSSLVTAPVQTNLSYWVRVNNAAGSIDSQSVTVTESPMVPSRLLGVGYNAYGQLADGTNTTFVTPSFITGGVTRTAAGPDNSFFIKNNGDLWATGENNYGKLGDGSTATRFIPVRIDGQVAQVTAGVNHSLFIKTDKSLWGMGYNSNGELGDTTRISRSTPVAVANSVIQAAAGENHSLFVKSDGSLWSMGSNSNGQLGDGSSTSSPIPVHIADSVIMAAAGSRHSLFLKSDGTLWAMGYNYSGQLGDGTTTNRLWPIQVASGVVRVTANYNHSLFIKSDGSLWVMGDNDEGQLGTGNKDDVQLPTKAGEGIKSMATGPDHSFFLKFDNSLWAMGRNYHGQLGDGTDTSRLTPVQVATSVTSFVAGGNHSLYCDSRPSIDAQPTDIGMIAGETAGFSVSVSGAGPYSYQWYYGNSGDTSSPVTGATTAIYQPPSGTNGTSYWVRITTAFGTVDSQAASVHQLTLPVILSASSGATISSGENAVLKVSATGGMLDYQWFRGLSGDTTFPVEGATGPLFVSSPLTSGSSFWVRTSNAAGATDSAAIPVNVTPPVSGYLLSTGSSSHGQSGAGINTRFTPTPIIGGVAKVSTGIDHTLILKTDSSLWKIPPNSSTPVQITTGVTWIASDNTRSAFVKSDGSLWIFSLSSSVTPTQIATGVSMVWFTTQVFPNICYLKTNGSLVSKTTFNLSAPETIISQQVVTASASPTHLLYVKTDGTLWGVGLNLYGELGNTYGGITSQRQLSSNVTKTAAGYGTTYFVKNDGTLWGMGLNTYRQFGSLVLATSFYNGIPFPVALASGVADVSTNANHAMFIKKDGSLWGMGLNSSGQLGDGTSADREAPVLIARQVSQVAAGSLCTFFVTTDGILWGTGSNQFGQLGTVVNPAASPVQVSDQVIAISAGNTHSLILKTDGTLWASGRNESGQLGDGTQINRPIPVLIASNVANASAGVTHSLFVKTDGSLWAMGSNSQGQLGDGTTLPRLAPVQIASNVSLANAGNIHSQFLKTDGTLWAMGDNLKGQLGDNTNKDRLSPVLITDHVAMAVAGDSHSLFLKHDGSLWGMGENGSSQLGTLGSGRRFTPIHIAESVTRMAAGTSYSSFIKSDDSLWGMGDNSYGQLGDGTADSHTTPVQVATAVADVSAGNDHRLFIKTDGTLWANGADTFSKLGDGTTSMRLAPVQVASAITAASAGGTHSLWLTSTPGNTVTAIGKQPLSSNVAPNRSSTLSITAIGSGTLSYQWYSGLSGDTSQPMAGSGSASFTTPPLSISSNYWVRVSSASGTADSHTARIGVLAAPTITSQPMLAGRLPSGGVRLTAAGSATTSSYQWYFSNAETKPRPVPGATGPTLLTLPIGINTEFWVKVGNSSGEVQSNRLVVSPQPAAAGRYLRAAGSSYGSSLIQKAGAVASVSTGANHSLFVKTSGTLWALGTNGNGQFGNGTTNNSSNPVQITSNVSVAAAGSTHSLFVKNDRSLWAMGLNNYGQLGDGTNISKTTPVLIAQDVVSVAAGNRHSLFIKTDGTLWAMGDNSSGKLGDGTPVQRRTPVQIASSVVMAAAGYDHSLFLKTDGSVWGMGSNTFGQLGTTVTNLRTPAKIADNVIFVATGDYQSLFISTDGTLLGMGRNDRGQLGYGAVDSDWSSNFFGQGIFDRLPPKLITANTTFASAGTAHSLWTKNEGDLWSVGSNSNGQLCVTSTAPKPPTKAQDRVWAASAGGNNSAILSTNSPLEPPIILTHPVSTYINGWDKVTFSVTASGPSLSYQWYRGPTGNTSQPISGATDSSYTILFPDSDMEVWVKVSNSAAYSESSAATATLSASPTAYQDWAAAHGLEGPDASPGADPDNDSRNNLLEYANDTSPNHYDSSPIVNVGMEFFLPKTDFIVQLRNDRSLRYTCWITSDLITWESVPLEFVDDMWTTYDSDLHLHGANRGFDNMWEIILFHRAEPEKLFLKITVEK